MINSPAIYSGLPRNVRSQGFASVQLPFPRLINHFVREFVLLTIRAIEEGTKIPRPIELLDEYELSEDLLSLDRAFEGYEPAEQEWDRTLTGVDSLRRIADDLCASDGSWNDDREMFREAASELAECVLVQAQQLIGNVIRQHGLRSSRQMLRVLKKRLLRTRAKLAGQPPVATRDATALVAAESQRIRNIPRRANPLIRIVAWFLPKMKLGNWLTTQQKSSITRCERAISELAKTRFQSLERQACLRVLDEVLGTDGTKGLLDQLDADLQRRRDCFVGLKAGLMHHAASSSPPQPVVEVVSSLNDILEKTAGIRVRDVMFDLAAQAGCTPKHLSTRLISEGIRVGRGELTTDRWHKIEPDRLVRILLKTAKRYFGLADEHANLNPEDPRSAADHLATFNLQHPALNRRVSFCCAEALQRSQPYFEAEPLHGVTEHVETFVFSTPKHRRYWIERVQSQGRVAETDNDTAYSISHPFRVDFLQVAVCVPGGASKSLHRSAVLACQNERHRGVSSHVDRRQYAEQRILSTRVRNIGDCEAILKSAKLAGIVSKLGQDALILNRGNARLQELFAPSRWGAAQITSDTLQALLKHDARTVDFLSQLFPAQVDIRQFLEELKAEDDADRVAETLVRRGLFRRLSGRYAVSADFCSRPQDAPPRLLQRSAGRLRGLPEDEFLTALLRNDLLYSTLFFGIQDAWQRGWIQEKQVPESVVEYTRILF